MRTSRCLLLLALLVPATLPAQAVATVPPRTPSEVRTYREIVRRVETTMLTVAWKDVALADVVKDLRRELRLNLLVARPLRDRAAEETVDLELTRVAASTVLRLLSEQHKIVFQNRDGIVWVTTPEDALERSLVLGLYGVHDLLYVPPDFPAPDIGISIGPPGERDEIETERESIDPEFILDLIRQATGPSNWETEGVTLTLNRGLLVMRHTPEMHAKVRSFLGRLRGAL